MEYLGMFTDLLFNDKLFFTLCIHARRIPVLDFVFILRILYGT